MDVKVNSHLPILFEVTLKIYILKSETIELPGLR